MGKQHCGNGTRHLLRENGFLSILILTRYRGVVECGQIDLEKEITMPKPQPSFTAEFKHEAVQLTKTSGKPKAQIARELGISDSALSAWCKAAEAHGEEAFPGKGHQLPLEEEIHRDPPRFRAGSTGA